MAQDSADWNSDDDLDFQIDNYQSSPRGPSPVITSSDQMFATLVDMGFSVDMITRAINEHGPSADTSVIIDAISKYTIDSEPSSSKSKTIDHFLAMGFDEEKVITAIREHGEDDMDQIANALLSCAAEKLPVIKEEADTVIKEEADIDWTDSDDDTKYAGLLSSDDEKVPDSSPENGNQLRSLVKMGFSELEASLALQRCGGNVSIAELADFICAAQIARESDEFYTDREEEKPIHNVKKRRIEPRQEPRPSADDEPIRLPNPMIGFGVPNEPGLITHRSISAIAQGPPYFYYENVALAPKGVWETISRQLYDIAPEFVDSKFICAAARKRGYVHNLPISGRYQIQPPPKYTVTEAFPLTKKWWPTWDKRTKLNCVLTVFASAQLTSRIRLALENDTSEAEEPTEGTKKFVIDQCKKWNLVWVGKHKAAPLEPDEMETLLGFPRNHTRGGGISRTERLKSLGNSFQVDTVAYHLSVLKPLFPNGINVLSLFTGIGGGEVALHRLQIPMKTVVSVEISPVNRNILKDFWKQTDQKGVLIEFADVHELSNDKIIELMKRYGGFDLVIGGSPCNNLAGGNRVTRSGLEGDQSSLFYEYCRILEVVRETTKAMRRS